HDAAAGLGFRDEDGVDLALGDSVRALRLADVDAARVAPSLRHDSLRHQPVVDDDVGLLQGALGAQRQKILRPRPGPDERDMPSAQRCNLEHADGVLLRLLNTSREYLLGDCAGEEARPVAAPLTHVAQYAGNTTAQAIGKPRQIAQ